MTTYTVGRVARLAGVTVRTLHHYDDIGLLTPTRRTASGYRLYGDADIDRLRDILAYRELGLGLDEITEALASVDGSISTMVRARDRMLDRIEHLRAIVATIDDAIAAEREGTTMTAEEKLSVFGDFDPAEHAEEARERWGGTDAYRESTRRAATYDAADWERIKAEGDLVYAEAARLAAEGADVSGTEARALVESHRNHISDNFYECSPEIHVGLGHMYEADDRFTRTIDRAGEGAAAFLSGAIAAYYGAGQAT